MNNAWTGRIVAARVAVNQRVINRIIMATLLAGSLGGLLSACSSVEKKEYAALPDVVASIDVKSWWVKPVGELSERAHRQLPVVMADNKIYVASANGDVGALAIDNGKPDWVVSLNEILTSGPGVGGDKLFVATNDAELIALDRSSGKEVWRSQLSSLMLSLPYFADNRLFVQTNDEKLFALDANTGERIWAEGREVPSLSLRGTASPTVVDGKVIAGFASGVLIAFDMQTGKAQWESTIAVPRGRSDLERIVDIDGLFVAQDNVIYVSTYQGRIAAVAAEDGRIIWTRDLSSYAGVSLQGNLVSVTDAEGYVWALDRKTGATLWRQEKLKDRDLSAPVAVPGAIVVADRGGYVHWLSMDDGAFVARKNLKQFHDEVFIDWGDREEDEPDYGVTIFPAVSGNVLLIRSNMGDLAQFRMTPAAAKTP